MKINEDGSFEVPSEVPEELVDTMLLLMNRASHASTIFTLMRVLDMIRRTAKLGLEPEAQAVLGDLVSQIERFKRNADIIFEQGGEWEDVDWD